MVAFPERAAALRSEALASLDSVASSTEALRGQPPVPGLQLLSANLGCRLHLGQWHVYCPCATPRLPGRAPRVRRDAPLQPARSRADRSPARPPGTGRGDAVAPRANPGAPQPRHRSWTSASAATRPGLMRINHTGEVCAQALYVGQAAVARDEATRAQLLARRAGGNRPPGLVRRPPARARQPPEPVQPAVVRRQLRHRPGRGPARRRLEPGLRGRDRAPGRGPPGRTPGGTCRPATSAAAPSCAR